MSNGSLGFRFGAEGVGRWNLDLGDTVPLLSADGPGPDGLSESVLGAVIILGMVNTVVANMFGHYDYRTGVSIWFRGIFRLDLHPDLMSQAPIGFQLHALAAFLRFALWPFTRLVHAFSAHRVPVAALRHLPEQGRKAGQPSPAPRLGTNRRADPTLIRHQLRGDQR